MNMKNVILFSLTLLSSLFFACEDEKNARVEVWLTDAPGDFQEVNVDVQGVEIHSSETDNENGWRSLDVTPTVHDLLKLTNGKETLLGGIELPGGRLSQIRLKLGDDNTVKIDDKVLPLATPSAQQSGLKIQLHQVLAEGITYKILLDFDAAKSVVETGNETYSLIPVIRAVAEAQDGGIKGKVEPAAAVSIEVFSGDESVTTTTANDQGEFLIRGLPAGTYRLVFDGPGDAPIVEKTGIEVAVGEVTDLGSVAVAE